RARRTRRRASRPRCRASPSTPETPAGSAETSARPSRRGRRAATHTPRRARDPPRTRSGACRRCARSRRPRAGPPSRCRRVVRDVRRSSPPAPAMEAWPKCSRKRHNLDMASLAGTSVLVAGAGLAGLAAARDLAALGAAVTVVDARDRVGGRVWTIRDGFAERQHAEAGGDMIDEAQHEIRGLATELGLSLTRILRGGFGAVRLDASGRPRIVSRNVARGGSRLEAALAPVMRPYKLAEQRWDTPIAAAIARRSVAGWLDEHKDDSELRATATGLRGFFLADPEELSLIAVVDQFAASEQDNPWNLYRIDGGNDGLARALAKALGDRVRLNTDVVAVSHRGRSVRVSVRNARATDQITCDYLLLALPATIVRRLPITPALPAQQHDAIARLKYGRGTKTLLQFSSRFWRLAGRPRAFGTPLPFGAFWDGNEEQRGRAG